MIEQLQNEFVNCSQNLKQVIHVSMKLQVKFDCLQKVFFLFRENSITYVLEKQCIMYRKCFVPRNDIEKIYSEMVRGFRV